jgi:predicted O-methyltransferase YrrM
VANAVLHPLVEEILATGRTELPDGRPVIADSYIPRDECELLYEVIAASGALRVVETGMAYGVSSLCIADAIHRNANGKACRLVSIDSHQTISFQRAAVHLLGRAGYAAESTLIEEPSQFALPRLVTHGERFDAGFIDGWHTFDHTLIDFFFIDQMLEPGGFVVFDDVGYPAINAAVRFILANRDYELTHVRKTERPVAASLRLRRNVKRLLRPLSRTDRDPKAEHEKLFGRIENVHAVALRKRGSDTRRWDHFERF